MDNKNDIIPSSIPDSKIDIYIEKTPDEIENDFPDIPFIRHCSMCYREMQNKVPPNMTEQNQILHYIDSFNTLLELIASDYGIEDFHIYTESVQFSCIPGTIYPMSYIIFSPYTKTMKKSKYPVSIVFTTRENLPYDYEHGRIDFMLDGSIGKSQFTIIRKDGESYNIRFNLYGSTLSMYELIKYNVYTNESKILFKR